MPNVLVSVLAAVGTIVLAYRATEGQTRRVLVASVSVIWAAHILSDVAISLREAGTPMHNLLFPVLMLGSVLVLACLTSRTRAQRITFVLAAIGWWAALVFCFLLVGEAAGAAGWFTR